MTGPLAEPPVAGDETDTLLGALERNRRVLAWKCEGLDAAAMATTAGASSLTIGGVLRHLATVERDVFAWRLHAREPFPGATMDSVEARVEADWRWTATDDPAAAWREWQESVALSRALVAEALADGGLGRAEGFAFPDGQAPSLRRLLVDMIEEYARHTGHVDLLREVVDGRVGEDAPEETVTSGPWAEVDRLGRD